MTREEEISKYGLWKMRALKTCRVYGHQIEIGETFSIPGNNALNFAYGLDAEFVDTEGRRAREEQVEKAAKELKIPVNYQTQPEFASPPGVDFPDLAPVKRK